MAEAKWLPFDGLVQIVLARFKAISVGAAEGTVRKALASGDVRPRAADPVLLTYDDGMLDMNMRPGATNKGGVSPDGKLYVQPPVEHPSTHYSVDDFLYWLRLNPPPQTKAPVTPPATESRKQGAKPREQRPRDIIKDALKALKPDPTLPLRTLKKRVEDELKKLGRGDIRVTRDTLARACGRRK
jgi:hypothetical protein